MKKIESWINTSPLISFSKIGPFSLLPPKRNPYSLYTEPFQKNPEICNAGTNVKITGDYMKGNILRGGGEHALTHKGISERKGTHFQCK